MWMSCYIGILPTTGKKTIIRSLYLFIYSRTWYFAVQRDLLEEPDPLFHHACSHVSTLSSSPHPHNNSWSRYLVRCSLSICRSLMKRLKQLVGLWTIENRASFFFWEKEGSKFQGSENLVSITYRSSFCAWIQ